MTGAVAIAKPTNPIEAANTHRLFPAKPKLLAPAIRGVEAGPVRVCVQSRLLGTRDLAVYNRECIYNFYFVDVKARRP